MNRDFAVRELRARIRAYLRGDATYLEFERDYLEYYIDNGVDSAFSELDHATYGSLFERLQWTASDPTEGERASGYHSRAETEAWIREHFQQLR